MQSIFEHKPNENLLEVIPDTANHLAQRVYDLDPQDEDTHNQILRTTIASLSAFNTDVIKGYEFRGIESFMLEMMQPQIDRGDICIIRAPHYDGGVRLNRDSLILFPGDMRNVAFEVQKLIKTEETGKHEPIMFDRVMIHAHFDTVGVFHQIAQNGKTYFDAKENLVYSKGACDMKGSLATLPIVYEQLIREGIPLPVLVLTADEEIAGEMGGVNLTKSFRSSLLNIDLEPTVCVPGTAVTELLPYYLILIDDLNLSPFKLHRLVEEMNKLFSTEALPLVSQTEEQLVLSVMTEGFSDNHQEQLTSSLMGVLGRVIGRSEVFAYICNDKGMKSSITKETKSAVKKALDGYYHLKYKKEKPYTVVTRGIPQSNGFIGRPHFSKLYSNFSTNIILAHGDNTPWIILGPDEEGGGRHSSTEAVNIDELRQMGSALVDIVRRMHS